MDNETKKALATADKAIGQAEKRGRERSFEARLGMAISDAEKKRIINQKLESDARRKLLKKKSKQRKIDAKKQTKKILQQSKGAANRQGSVLKIQQPMLIDKNQIRKSFKKSYFNSPRHN
jgi:tRNA G18 (ribose-2'-O)-methylase SpoU